MSEADLGDLLSDPNDVCERHSLPYRGSVPSAPNPHGISRAVYRCPAGCQELRAFRLAP